MRELNMPDMRSTLISSACQHSLLWGSQVPHEPGAAWLCADEFRIYLVLMVGCAILFATDP
jgi:hypothetical protein